MQYIIETLKQQYDIRFWFRYSFRGISDVTDIIGKNVD